MTKGGESDIIENRGNPNHDPITGQFTSGAGSIGKTKYAPSPRRNNKGITVKPKTYAMLCGEFNTKYPNAEKGLTGNVYKGKYAYIATADGEGGIMIKYKRKI